MTAEEFRAVNGKIRSTRYAVDRAWAARSPFSALAAPRRRSWAALGAAQRQTDPLPVLGQAAVGAWAWPKRRFTYGNGCSAFARAAATIVAALIVPSGGRKPTKRGDSPAHYAL